MPHINEIRESNYLSKEDCGRGILVTIKEVKQVNIAREDDAPDMKWACFFVEPYKPMILKSTNAQIIAQITGKPKTEDWTGAKIVLFHDPMVSMSGKLVGGIRPRAPRPQPAAPVPGSTPAATAPAAAQVVDPIDDNIPF